MSRLFDELKEIVKKEFGYTLEKNMSVPQMTFESLFGIDILSGTESDVSTVILEATSLYNDTYVVWSFENSDLEIESTAQYEPSTCVVLAA